MCQWGQPPSSVVLLSTSGQPILRSGGSLGARAPSESYPCAGVDSGLFNIFVVTVARPLSAAKRGRGVCHRGWWAAFMPRKGYSSRIAERSRWIGRKTLRAGPMPEVFSTRASTPLHPVCQWGLLPGVIWLRSSACPVQRSGWLLVARAPLMCS
ncbi:hypothetical protein SCHPADRAFT_11945 [Schizopora paradoxa]|uniref:Uncharacterized protein n=1 Tax=Schizopora paradoxa TaxID=27342 RepID=A0A0H2S9M0_9AGAM|nr:hypothetical protein SCHPADRAFT_11945 [Schizopora paradoxa]